VDFQKDGIAKQVLQNSPEENASTAASVNCGDGLPNTLVTSPLGSVRVFSSTMFAVAIAPTSQPARVQGTQGALERSYRPP
jgi:hypothetical protein